MKEQVKTVYWHRELPPLDAKAAGEHTLEATSGHVPGTIAHREELWDQCRDELMAQIPSTHVDAQRSRTDPTQNLEQRRRAIVEKQDRAHEDFLEGAYLARVLDSPPEEFIQLTIILNSRNARPILADLWRAL